MSLYCFDFPIQPIASGRHRCQGRLVMSGRICCYGPGLRLPSSNLFHLNHTHIHASNQSKQHYNLSVFSETVSMALLTLISSMRMPEPSGWSAAAKKTICLSLAMLILIGLIGTMIWASLYLHKTIIVISLLVGIVCISMLLGALGLFFLEPKQSAYY